MPCTDPTCTRTCDPCAQHTGRDLTRPVDRLWLGMLAEGDPVTFYDVNGGEHHAYVRRRERVHFLVVLDGVEMTFSIARGEGPAGYLHRALPSHPEVVRRAERGARRAIDAQRKRDRDRVTG